ncbi:uncharacterized protein RHOBADRAFT_36373 [Rhodotorula graminis WP1]|uniref:RhoGAP-domain-containing protein n=1 Tax=Rhodotorula graminis (strain WP1) TaxID=578459 RepID=A0A194S4K5_RHOGW|nr:uncharacterized protein RHOBADRAFT_36373 [Rhodotorula graminis WP1]KPV75517.1 hypothetical protein RHOBADRAFT_36373 [Rhodotorula graminis WP1]
MHPPSRPASSSSHSHDPRERERNGYGGPPSAASGSRSRGNSAASSNDGTGREVTRSKRSERGPPATCAKCALPMTGQFVRALGTVYHLDCFRCQDCSKVVAAKFFPIDSPDGGGRQVPLCETDYFRRLGLLCHKCGQALRGSYITALDMKFHVEHFTCSVCPTVFGPQDSYYEHAGSVYCHFHYSTRFAVKCTGCRTAILKQFVEINRNSIDEHWHPECYMIHKFWNLKLAPTPKLPPEYLAVEEVETPSSLKARQRHMEEQVYRIWTILSAFEESSAACISEMLRHVSSGHYMEGVGMAEKFVLHVETLFAAIDDLNAAFRAAGAKEMSHVREARMLCKKVVNFFMLLSHTHETGARKMSITQELLSLVTGLAHYLKILIRIALTGSLKLEREHGNGQAIGLFLGRLDRLARDPEANKISATVAALGEATTDLCEGCRLTVEEECARLGTSVRWHLPCLRCPHCHRCASKDEVVPDPHDEVSVADFVWVDGAGDEALGAAFCRECASRERGGSLEGTAGPGQFAYVTRLEQYAFLLCVALNKLFGRLKQRGVVGGQVGAAAVDEASDEARSLSDAYRDSTDIKRMKSVQLDRKLSATQARTPMRSTVVQSPAGRTATSDATTDSTFTLFQTKPPPDGLGGSSEPTQDEEGLTLADLPKALEAEQRRSDPSRPSPPPASLGTIAFVGDRGGFVGAPPAALSLGPKLLSELSALEYFIVKHVAAVLLSSESSALRDAAPLDELLEMIDARKNTFWGKLFKGGQEKKSVKKKGVFGIPLEILVERNGADSMHGAGPGSLRIPSFVDDVISAMKQMDMSIEGIFRKNGNIRRLKDLTEALDRDSGSVNLSDDNPVQLAALLKKFLRDLPDPLMTFKLFHLFIAAQRVDNEDERKRMMHYVCCLMPKPHRDTMEVLFVFLKWVASFSHVDEETGSKMDLQNLATVISPNILYAKGKDPARDESFSAARVVHELLELQDEFWEVPAECLSILNDQELFANPSQLTSKEILARAENHIRLFGRGTGFRVSRGEASPPRRPGLQEAWSAPVVPGGLPSGSRPLSTSVSPSQLLRSPERPVAFANPQQASGPVPPHPAGLPQPRPGAGNSSWLPGPPHPGRFDESSRRGSSEGTAYRPSNDHGPHSQPPSHASSPQHRGHAHTPSTHPYQ